MSIHAGSCSHSHKSQLLRVHNINYGPSKPELTRISSLTHLTHRSLPADQPRKSGGTWSIPSQNCSRSSAPSDVMMSTDRSDEIRAVQLLHKLAFVQKKHAHRDLRCAWESSLGRLGFFSDDHRGLPHPANLQWTPKVDPVECGATLHGQGRKGSSRGRRYLKSVAIIVKSCKLEHASRQISPRPWDKGRQQEKKKNKKRRELLFVSLVCLPAPLA